MTSNSRIRSQAGDQASKSSRLKEKSICPSPHRARSTSAASCRLSATRRSSSLMNELAAGAPFILVNDHDPKPLYYQLEAEYPKQFGWTYVETRPDGMARGDRSSAKGRLTSVA